LLGCTQAVAASGCVNGPSDAGLARYRLWRTSHGTGNRFKRREPYIQHTSCLLHPSHCQNIACQYQPRRNYSHLHTYSCDLNKVQRPQQPGLPQPQLSPQHTCGDAHPPEHGQLPRAVKMFMSEPLHARWLKARRRNKAMTYSMMIAVAVAVVASTRMDRKFERRMVLTLGTSRDCWAVVVRGVRGCLDCQCRFLCTKGELLCSPGTAVPHRYIMRRCDPMTRGTVMRLLGMKLLLLFW
jgi:hypothetical protein